MAESQLKIRPKDVRYRNRRGFARLWSGKLRQISTAASARGAAKGGRSPQVTAARLKLNNLLDWLRAPFALEAREFKVTDAATAIGVSRQCMRRLLRKYGISTRRERTAFMVSNASMKFLHQKLREDLYEHVSGQITPKKPVDPALRSEQAPWLALLRSNFHSFLIQEREDKRVYVPTVEARKIVGVGRPVFNRWCKEKKLREKRLRGVSYITSASMRTLRARALSEIRRLKIEL